MLDNIFNFISEKYKDKDLLKGFDYMEKNVDKIDNNFLKNTMRMTIF